MTPKLKVVIEVSGGVAECTSGDDKVEVVIIDHDNEEAEEARICWHETVRYEDGKDICTKCGKEWA